MIATHVDEDKPCTKKRKKLKLIKIVGVNKAFKGAEKTQDLGPYAPTTNVDPESTSFGSSKLLIKSVYKLNMT